MKTTPYSDDSGNVQCEACGKIQSSAYEECVHCCKHERLKLCQEWFHWWELSVKCDICGLDHGFDRRDLIKNYTVVKKFEELDGK